MATGTPTANPRAGGGYEPDGVTIVLNVNDELEGVGGVPPDGSIALIKIADQTGPGVLARTANTAGVVTLATGTDGQVARVSGTTFGFGALAAGAFADNTIALARLANPAAKTVLVNATNGAAAVTAMAAATGGHVLRNNAANTALEWGTLLSDSYADNTIALARLANMAGPGIIGKFASGAGATTTLLASAGSDGQVPTIQADGTIAWETPAGGGGTIDGSGAANRLAVWSDADTLTGFATLTFNSATKRLGDASFASLTLDDASVSILRYENCSLSVSSTGIHVNNRLRTTESSTAVASAATIVLRSDGASSYITGTSTINFIDPSNWSYSNIAILRFASTATLAHNAGAGDASGRPIRTRTAANRTVTAGSWTLLTYDPDTLSWYELGG